MRTEKKKEKKHKKKKKKRKKQHGVKVQEWETMLRKVQRTTPSRTFCNPEEHRKNLSGKESTWRRRLQRTGSGLNSMRRIAGGGQAITPDCREAG